MNNIISSTVDTNKVFIIYSADLEGRVDPEYYRPSITKLERQIRSKANGKLRDYIKKMASGATPSIAEEEKYYSNEEEGIPFLRVQNLQTNGELFLEDIKYINKDTHENSLKRSQVNEYDLLVKITGVGRMAIASLAPAGFIGNTNQHMVVIKTDSKEMSTYLSYYLNLDIIEKIASRRTTGGTRPALDYPALKSIPVIEKIDFSKLKEAEEIKKKKYSDSQMVIKKIDEYLLRELDITIPTKKYNLRDRIFIMQYLDLMENRLDPLSILNKEFRIEGGKYPNQKLKNIAKIVKGQSITSNKIIEGKYPVIAGGQSSPYSHCEYNHEGNVITVSASGAYAGYVWYHSLPIFASDCSVIKSKDEQSLIKTKFLYEVLKIKQKEIYTFQQGAGQPHVYGKDLEKLNIPIPPIDKQVEIIENINILRSQVLNLQQEADNILLEAKKEIEKYILKG